MGIKNRTRVIMKTEELLDQLVDYREYKKFLLLPKEGVNDELRYVMDTASTTYDIMVQTPLWFNITDEDSGEYKQSQEFIRELAELPRLKGLVFSPMAPIHEYKQGQLHDRLMAWINFRLQPLLRMGTPVLLMNSSDAPNKLQYLRDVHTINLLRAVSQTNLKFCWSPQNSLSRSGGNPDVVTTMLPVLGGETAAVRAPMLAKPPFSFGGETCSVLQVVRAKKSVEVFVPRKAITEYESKVVPYV